MSLGALRYIAQVAIAVVEALAKGRRSEDEKREDFRRAAERAQREAEEREAQRTRKRAPR